MKIQKEYFSRNKGLITEEEQKTLADTCIAIAGAGGDGGLLAERLIRSGIGKLILADPEQFEPANINRQFAANIETIGKNKATEVAKALRLINPNARIIVYEEGITADNVSDIVSMADILIDEIEYSLPSISVMLHREARRQGKYVFMGANIGWGASIFCFSPKGTSFETHFEYNETAESINPLRYLKTQPEYISDETVTNILTGQMAMPAVASSVSLVAAVISQQVILFIIGKRQPLFMPEFITIDLYDLSIK